MLKLLWQGLLNPQIRLNSARISLVVGSILNLINQGPAFWASQRISWAHLALNYLVPFLVATYSAAKNAASR
ncbi:MAG: nitrate/nitrite transporter NrtS [Aquabacterium sp.]|uniref:nitrate/nitrite transporter NrtS n=1 Tax=Aquabacterium sp. TaxID=1872578 RepID=UPI0025C6D0A7|nr:nitrate/nitrite transporter NrtS [Aquabacterium sp.]MBI5924661.1 nitrate/nitrite transporter NrtS [Aquabacterium sp.]